MHCARPIRVRAKIDRSPVESCDYKLPRNSRKIPAQCFQALTNSRFTQFIRSPLFSYDCALPRGGVPPLQQQTGGYSPEPSTLNLAEEVPRIIGPSMNPADHSSSDT